MSDWHPRRFNTLHQYFTQSFFSGKVENKTCPKINRQTEEWVKLQLLGFFCQLSLTETVSEMSFVTQDGIEIVR